MNKWICAVVVLCCGVGCKRSGGGSGNPTPGANPFANTFEGELALRTPNQQLTGDFAAIQLVMAGDFSIGGTVSVNQPGILPFLVEGEQQYTQPGELDESVRPLTLPAVTVSGTVDSATGSFSAVGSGADSGGIPVTVNLSGLLQQLDNSQVATTSVSIASATATASATGFLTGQAAVPLPGNVIPPPILQEPLRIPRGITVRFLPTGNNGPANPDQTETGDVVNFTVPNYNSPGFDGYSNIDSGEWLFRFDGVYFTVSVPMSAPVTGGYEIRDRSTGMRASAVFEVIECPLQEYSGTNFIGDPILADADFFPTLAAIDDAAGAAGVRVFVTNSFRVAGQTLQGTVVPPASRSNHLVGHAIDMNVQYQSAGGATTLCNSGCLGGSNLPAAVADFLARVQAAGVTYGGNFQPVDVVHFDDRYNSNAARWDERYGILQQCARAMGL